MNVSVVPGVASWDNVGGVGGTIHLLTAFSSDLIGEVGMFTQLPSRRTYAPSLEPLEERLNLAGDCLFEPTVEGDAAAAVKAVNCFALDLYEHYQNEEGNLVLSPLSIATGLAMTYAGAAGETAEEMAEVLHLGSDPGIHSSFRSMLGGLADTVDPSNGYELAVANAIWPSEGLTVREEFVRTVREEYGGEAQTLDYSRPDQAKETINSWVEEKTRDRIKDLIERLSPATAMVLTNSIYMKALWEMPFPNATPVASKFYLDDGDTVEVDLMYTQANVARTTLDGFDVMEMPFKGNDASMVLILPQERNGPNEVPSQTLVKVNDWMDAPRETELMEVMLPKFKTTVSSQLKKLLPEMGMPRAFSGAADFSAMTDAKVFIDEVSHKAMLEVTEQGIEAAAATAVNLFLCFAAGTPVITPDGEKPIEDLKAGDYVLSRNEHNIEGNVEPKLVEETFQGQGEIFELHVGGQVIRVTEGHRFFLKGKGWTPAGEMKPGDQMATDSFDWKAVDRVTTTGESEPVYNFRVADHHTYFVGKKAWGFGVWTHNLYGSGFVADHPFHFLIRDNATSTFLFMGRVNDPTQTDNSLEPTVERIPGDANGDGQFDSSDLVLVFQAGKYEDDIARNAEFAEGDWDGDGDFTSSDLTYAFQNSVYVRAAAAPLNDIAAAVLDTDENSDDGLDADQLDAVFTELAT